jgi:hypothetical protein
MSDAVRWAWRPQEGPQKALVDCPLKEIFFGGTRGGGKTDGVLRSKRSDVISKRWIACQWPMASARFRTIQVYPKDLVRDWRHSRPQGR